MMASRPPTSRTIAREGVVIPRRPRSRRLGLPKPTKTTQTTQTTQNTSVSTFNVQTTFTQTTETGNPNGPNTLTVHTYANMDPNIQGLTSDVGVLAGGSAFVSSSMIVPLSWLSADSFTLTNIAQNIQNDQLSAQNAYWGRNDGADGSTPWNASLYNSQAGVLNPAGNPGNVISTGIKTTSTSAASDNDDPSNHDNPTVDH